MNRVSCQPIRPSQHECGIMYHYFHLLLIHPFCNSPQPQLDREALAIVIAVKNHIQRSMKKLTKRGYSLSENVKKHDTEKISRYSSSDPPHQRYTIRSYVTLIQTHRLTGTNSSSRRELLQLAETAACGHNHNFCWR